METRLEHESLELPQSVGEACPSNSDVNNRHPTLEPNHDIFLSHSGKQKDFTEQLYWELKRCQFHPFFDNDPDSLPVGKKFPERIFSAARQCRVAVFILSEDFFTNSKWPMLELAAFVESQKESQKESGKEPFLIPVYLRISKDEVKDESNRQRWFDVWSTWQPQTSSSTTTIEKTPIDVLKWKEGLETLLQCNGLDYNTTIREHGLIQEIVAAVWDSVPTRNPLSDPNVQGVNQICKAIDEKISKTQPSPSGVRMVGIYGIGGIGKTTCCKVLCDYMNKEFQGRVCHAELGSLSGIELQKEVLWKLTNVNHKTLKTSTDANIGELLKEHIHQQKVFLALDNVWPESEDEAHTYLDAGFRPGSIVMVTTRSDDILVRLKLDRSACMEMPELEAEDARRLFLHNAAPDFRPTTQDDHDNIQFCIDQCHFSKGEHLGETLGAHFHPLALKVLGGQLQSLGCDPSIWVKNLSKDKNKFNQSRQEHPVFGILRRSYDLLSDEDQLLFMDVVLFHPDWRQNEFTRGINEHGASLYDWFRIVHNSSLRVMKKRLEGLKEKSLLDSIGDGVRGVSVHDLYVEFAKMEAKRGALDARRCVCYGGDGAIPMDLWKTPSGICWQNVERVSVVHNRLIKEEIEEEDWFDRWRGTVRGVRWQHFANVLVLELNIHLSHDDVLDLSGLQCLRSLQLEVHGGGTVTGLGGLWNLAWLELREFHDAACVKEIGSLTKLEVLRLLKHCIYSFDCSSSGPPLKLSELHRCIRLRELVVDCRCLEAFPDLNMMTSLRKVVFGGCRSVTQALELGSQLCALQELRLRECKALRGLQGLGDLGALQVLEVDCVSKDLLQFPELRMLTCLRELLISYAPKLSVLPEFQNLVALEQLRLRGLPMLRELPDMHLLTKLRCIEINGVALRSDPAQLLNLVPPTPSWQCRGEDKNGGLLSSASGSEMSECYADWYKVTHFTWGAYIQSIRH